MGIGVIYSREKKAQESLKGGHTKSEVGLFSQAASDNNARGNDLKLHQRKFSADIRKKLLHRKGCEALEQVVQGSS